MNPDYKTSQRKRDNDRSKSWATRDGEPWTADEEDFLLHEWIDTEPDARDEVEVSKILERTIESCRMRCEIIRKRLGIMVCVKKTTVEVTTAYIGHADDPEDRWWSADYYNTEK